MTTLAIVQARVNSTRLPRKTLMPLAGQTVLARVLERLKTCRRLDGVIVATTEAPADQAICDEADRCGVPWYRGSESDVLERYQRAAERFAAETVVRVTADCPLIDAALIDKMVERYGRLQVAEPRVDYVSNTLQRSYPRGLDAEVFSAQALKAADAEARRPFEREHVTPFLYLHPERFGLDTYRQASDQSHLRWTLDEADDLAFFQAVFEFFPQRQPTTADVLRLLEERPELSQINVHVQQKKLAA